MNAHRKNKFGGRKISGLSIFNLKCHCNIQEGMLGRQIQARKTDLGEIRQMVNEVIQRDENTERILNKRVGKLKLRNNQTDMR